MADETMEQALAALTARVSALEEELELSFREHNHPGHSGGWARFRRERQAAKEAAC